MQALLIFALVVGATISTGPEQVPTSMCHDPLLGPSMIIYSDCGVVQEEPERRKKEKPESVEKPTEQMVELVDPQPAEQLVEEWNEQPVEKLPEQSNELPAEQPVEQAIEQRKEEQAKQPAESVDKQSVEQLPEQVTGRPTEQSAKQQIEQTVEKSKEKKQKCNKGSGNGADGCDPGNHPEKGNDDENGDGLTQNSNKEKTDRATEQETLEKQKCNKGSGNGGEDCDPGNHPENGNNDEGGDRFPQNTKKDKKR